ncbi:MAG: hypothetical protein ACI883_000292 [Candidatus Azotimanducaceae bacterium]|jgi:hypothetical protein|tara:strand:- start:1791 stop:2519 length:729 start_codon:yes stop_codon:yes gene_type:complete
MKILLKLSLTAISASLLVACGANSNLATSFTQQAAISYRVTLTNTTAAQPFSPVAIVLHDGSWSTFNLGEPASTELEMLAESGDNSALLAAAENMVGVFGAASGTGDIGPGESESIEVEVTESQIRSLSLSLVAMLVNTNDAIAALNRIDISTLNSNESMRVNALSYDTGTEANTETAATMPGPAAAGGAQEGFNAVRDDVRDSVFVHAGVVTTTDGLTTSALSSIHRWDHPAIQIRVERLN